MALAMGVGGDLIAQVVEGSWLSYAARVHFPIYAGGAVFLCASLVLPCMSSWLLVIAAIPFVLWALFLFLPLDIVIILPAVAYLLAAIVALIEPPAVWQSSGHGSNRKEFA